MKYLVTGGAGFIGSHLSEALVSDGHEVVAIDNLSTGQKTNVENLLGSERFNLVEDDITDRKVIEKIVEACDGIFHLAAAVGVKKILEDPIGSLHTNLIGTENVLLSASKHKKRVLLASTSEIYGKNDLAPLTEESDRILGSPLLSRWTYSEAKAIDEAFARVLFEREGLRVQIIRFFNTVGPRQSAAYGMAIPTFFIAAMRHQNLQIHGDGQQERVFCHIKDAVSGVKALWNSQVGYGEAFNLGGFEETSILDLAKKVILKTNSCSEISFIPYEELAKTGFEDIRKRIPVTTKLERATGWRAEFGLEQILDDVYGHLSMKVN